MKITLDTEKLKEKDGAITLYLLSLLSSCPITRATFEEVAQRKLFNGTQLSKEGKEIIVSTAESIQEDRDLSKLADKLREIFPPGKKPGSAYQWRDSTFCIVDRLKKFFEKYGYYSDDAIVEATKRYVNSFNGNYQYMQLLKYFIWKNKVTGEQLVRGRIVGEVERQSQLAAYLENTDDKPKSDWEVGLR